MPAFFFPGSCCTRRNYLKAAGSMKIRSARGFWSGLIYVLFGSTAMLVGRDYPMGTAFRMGPAFFPIVLGGLLLAIGTISLIRSFMVTGAPIGRFAIQGFMLVTGSVFLFGFLVRGLGVAFALPVLVMISAYASAKFRWGPTIVMALGLTGFCVLVFLKGLGIPLPVVGPWLGG